MRLLLVCALIVFAPMLFAEAALPDGCRVVAVQGDSVILKAKKGRLVFIHNLLATDLWLTHPVNSPGASAGWPSRIQAERWSALVVDKSSFPLSCIESKPGHEQQVACRGVIAVCQWKKVKWPDSSEGSFWAGEDMSLAELRASLGGRGFVLPGG
jgi:hypothetical protein